ncbi:MAG: folate-binding protein YgfZ [Propionibacteriales bacterium]|nr:folate-binding protein YgfZ [Propionibacteriales bacterium]
MRGDVTASPLLALPGAVEGEGIDAGVAAHYGDPFREQKALLAGEGFVDLSHRGVVRITGSDRLTWLHSLTSQHLTELAPDMPVATLVLSPQGHVEHALLGYDDGDSFWAHVEPDGATELVAWLDSMRFMMRVEVADVTSDWAAVARDQLRVQLVRRNELAELSTGGSFEGARACGTWAFEALRIARGEPRLGIDTDARTIPNEVGWIGTAVHLAKGCYRGQETIARIHNLGRPPRRLVRLHLDGSVDELPDSGAPVELDGRNVGFVGSAARHHELGPIALALVKRNVDVQVPLLAGGIDAAQEVIVDPEVGLHVRARL